MLLERNYRRGIITDAKEYKLQVQTHDEDKNKDTVGNRLGDHGAYHRDNSGEWKGLYEKRLFSSRDLLLHPVDPALQYTALILLL